MLKHQQARATIRSEHISKNSITLWTFSLGAAGLLLFPAFLVGGNSSWVDVEGVLAVELSVIVDVIVVGAVVVVVVAEVSSSSGSGARLVKSRR